MAYGETLVFYLLIGAGVAAADYLRRENSTAVECCWRAVTAWCFWPLYLPILLSVSPRHTAAGGPSAEVSRIAEGEFTDTLNHSIEQAEAELETALGSLDGWTHGLLSRERVRIAELRRAWHQQAERIRELDRLLERQMQRGEEQSLLPQNSASQAARWQRSEQARRENLARLQRIRDKLHGDLLGTLAWVRELVTMVHLAKFTGAPASRAEELVRQIAAAVEGLQEAASWQQTVCCDESDRGNAPGRASAESRDPEEGAERKADIPTV